VQRVAASKARAVADRGLPDALIISADTTVVDGNQILGKPVDKQDAERMLKRLRGRSHQVYTAIALWQNGKRLVDYCATEVPMREYSDTELQTYIASGDPLDKAGAYAIQHADFHPVDDLQGCYANVVGLPLCHLRRALSQFGIPIDADIPAACQSDFGYDCSIYNAVLQEK
jgi:MAF protein